MLSVLSAFIAWLNTGPSPPLDQNYSRESWLGVTWLGVHDLVLGIKRMDQHVSCPSAHLSFFSTTSSNLQMLEVTQWWKELNPVLEVSGFRGDSRAEAVPALWSWEKLGGSMVP